MRTLNNSVSTMSPKLNCRSNNTPQPSRHHSQSKTTNPPSLSRTPSSVHFSRSTSSNSLPAEMPSSNPVSEPPVAHTGPEKAFEEIKVPQMVPSFSVSTYAANVNNINKPPGRALNPAAKEFELPKNGTILAFGGLFRDPSTDALFAMPSQRRIPNMSPQAPIIASNYTTSWNVMGTEPQPRLQMPSASAEHSINYALNVDGTIVEKLVAYIRTTYILKCKEKKLHMVAVLNLEPHTIGKDLLDIFTAMNATEAITLNVNDLPYGIVSTNSCIIRRGIGVVFFSAKSFAILGVDKMNNFVPSGQHQQLIVRYCGPDGETLAPSGDITARPGNTNTNTNSSPVLQNQLPWILPPSDLEKVHEEMRLVYEHLGESSQFMVAIHGLCTSADVRVLKKNVMNGDVHRNMRWPPTNLKLAPQIRSSIPWRCRSVSAVVWYSSENAAKAAVRDLNNRIPEGQQRKVSLFLLGPPKPQPFPSSNHDALFGVGAPDQKNSVQILPTPPSFATAITIGTQAKKVLKAADGTSSSQPCTGAPGNDNAAIFAHIDAYFLDKFANPNYYIVAVHKLDIKTVKKNLHEIFYPHGAVDTELYPDVVIVEGKPRLSGLALFSSEEMAKDAASRFNEFVPNGQTRPLLTRYLERPKTNYPHIASKGGLNVPCPGRGEPASGASTITSGTGSVEQSMAALRSAGLGNGCRGIADFSSQQAQNRSAPFSTPRVSLNSVEDLLCSIENQLSSHNIDAKRLEEDMVSLANHSDSAQETGTKLAKLLVKILMEAKHQSMMLSTPLTNALSGLHDRLGIPKRDTATSNGACNNSLNEDSQGDMSKGITFVLQIATELLVLVIEKAISPQTRRVVGTLCAYSFQYSYLHSSPCKFAVKFLSKHRDKWKRAKVSASNDSTAIGGTDKDDQQLPWVSFIESFDDMTRFWLKCESCIKSDEYARQYLILRHEILAECESLSSGAMANSALVNPEKGAKADPSTLSPCGNTDYFNGKKTASGVVFNRDSMGGPTTANTTAAQGIGSTNLSSALQTPSARPTPLRVTKGSMTSGSGNRYKQPPPEGASSSAQVPPPRVMLTPGSNQTQGVTANTSLESAADQSTARGHAFIPDLNTRSPSAAHYSQTFANVIGRRNTSPSSRGTTAAGGVGNQVFPSNHAHPAAPFLESKPAAPSNMDIKMETFQRSPQIVIKHRPDVSECTVYITKLPSSFTASQVRRLFLKFGSITKVRLCHDDKEDATPAGASSNNHGRLCFVFVEFAETVGAKAIVEHFRNASHIPNAFDFMRQPYKSNAAGTASSPTGVATLTSEQKMLLERDIKLLAGTRASPARKPIHDQQYLDAVLRPPTPLERERLDILPNASILERECLFGVLMPDLAIENYNSNTCAELRLPLPSALTGNTSSNLTTHTPLQTPVVEGKVQTLEVNASSQPAFCSHTPTVNSADPIVLPSDAQSTADVTNLTHFDFLHGERDDVDKEEMHWNFHPSANLYSENMFIPIHELRRQETKKPPEGVIGDNADRFESKAKLTHSRESSLTRYNDTRSENTDINGSPNPSNIWVNLDM